MDNTTNKTTATSQTIKKVFSILAIIFFSIDAIIGALLVLDLIKGSETLGRIAASTSIAGLFCSLTVNGIIRLGSNKKSIKIPAIIAMVLNVVWLSLWLIVIWDGLAFLKSGCIEPEFNYDCYYSYDEYNDRSSCGDGYNEEKAKYDKCIEPHNQAVKAFGKTINLAGMTSLLLTLFANYIGLAAIDLGVRIMKTVTLVSATILVLSEIAIVNFEASFGDFWRFIILCSIIFIFSLLVTPILIKVAKKKDSPDATDKKAETAETKAAPAPAQEAAKNDSADRAQIEKELREQIEKEVRAEIAKEK